VTAVAALLGAGAGLGALLVLAGTRGISAAPPRPRAVPRTALLRAAAAIVVAVIVAGVTGWPVLGALSAAGVLSVPVMIRRRQRQAGAMRNEALAQWTEMLRDTMAGAAGLEEAIIVSARRPPPAIATAVTRLAARLEHHALPDALHAFASDLDDPTADLLAAALITAATNEVRDLGRLLAALVEATRAQVQMRASIEAGRAHVRSATRVVLGVTAVFTAALLLFSGAYLAPYATVEGQLWLALVGAVVAASLLLLTRLDRIDLPTARLVSTGSQARS
jgi:tight adherence protein B